MNDDDQNLRATLEELVHRVNNLLGTIAVQAEVARSDGSLAAHRDALRFISDSAGRTREELDRARTRLTSGKPAPDRGATS